jgi:hypothetical protein
MRFSRTLLTLALLGSLIAPSVRAAGTGPIVVDGRTFASWTDFFRSDYFKMNGKRCGTRTPTRRPGLDEILGGAGECSLDLTNPLAEYEPGVSCEIQVVVHRLESITGDGVFPDSLVLTQIKVLNEDYQAIVGTNGSAGYNSRIRFKLATRDPQGHPTTGWTRTQNEFWFNDLPDPLLGNYYDNLAWDPFHYLNIYTLSPEAPGGLILGYVPFFPQEGGVGSNEDGVRCLWNAFGRPSANAPYDLGRTVTHEVGHYLGLYHTFQDGCGTTAAPGCYSTGDRVCDTNPESASQGGCPVGDASCGLPDPIHDYMDYTDDICMNQFTHEQVRRIICTMRYYRPQICVLDQPTATLVQRFGAAARGAGAVDLDWSARVESDILGWNLYRGGSAGEERVNPEMIPTAGREEFHYTDAPGASGVVSYRLAGVGTDGSERSFGETRLLVGGTASAFSAGILGSNPSRGPVQIGFSLPERTRVRVDVFSVMGQRVRTLADGVREAGNHTETFSIRDGGGRPLGPGVYMVRVSAGGDSRKLKVVALD